MYKIAHKRWLKKTAQVNDDVSLQCGNYFSLPILETHLHLTKRCFFLCINGNKTHIHPHLHKKKHTQYCLPVFLFGLNYYYNKFLSLSLSLKFCLHCAKMNIILCNVSTKIISSTLYSAEPVCDDAM